MTDIQQARDALAKWADGATPRPWAIEEIPETGECRIVMVDEDLDAPTIATVTSGGMTRADASLIVGTAGNPDLLDELDEFLRVCGESLRFWERLDQMPGDQRVAVTFATRMAAAIIAADEQMSA